MSNSPVAPITIQRKDGKIFSPLRQKWLVEFPEETVRQEYVCTLVNGYGYQLEQMDEELHVPLGRGSVRADVVLWRSPADKTDKKPPIIVVEAKSDNVTIDVRDYGQGESYARQTDAPFFVTHNHRETRYWRVLKDRMPGYTQEITDIPRADASAKEVQELINKLKVFKEDEFADLLHECHNVIRNREHLDPAAAFDEIAKVLFIKVYVERDMRAKQRRDNRFTKAYLENLPGEHPLNLLFTDTVRHFRDDRLFGSNERLNLKPATAARIVELLERYNLSDTGEDVKGIAFEKFLGRTFRGEIGQFFTPREIVKFMVEMVEPREGDIVCDPASGSGGFLIRFFARVRERILADADAEFARFRAEVEAGPGTEAKKAERLRERFEAIQRTLDQSVAGSRMWTLANRCIYGTDANDRMARTSKMNMIMQGDGHGGVHHSNGFINVNGIFEGRFSVILTNPPFGSHVEPTDHVVLPEGPEWDEIKGRYGREYGDPYKQAVARVEAHRGKPIASLFSLPLRGAEPVAAKSPRPGRTDGKPRPEKGPKVKTELLFIERCLNLLQPGGRLGVVLPEGIFNNPSLAYVREFVEDRAWLRAVVSLPQETFTSSGASVKASVLFAQRFTVDEQRDFDDARAAARADTEAKHAPDIAAFEAPLLAELAVLDAQPEKQALVSVRSRLEALPANASPAKRTKLQDEEKAAAEAFRVARLRKADPTSKLRVADLNRQLADYRKRMVETIAMESRALLKERKNYPVFLYEAEKVGITATGEPDQNELYPNDRQPPGVEKPAWSFTASFARTPRLFSSPPRRARWRGWGVRGGVEGAWAVGQPAFG